MGLSEELARLAQLRDQGALTEDEFAKAKAEVMASGTPSFGQKMANSADRFTGDVTNLLLLMHLGQLVPGPGWLIPLLIWLTKKEDSSMIDAHGKVILNWILSVLIYGFVLSLLCLVVVGFFLLPILAILGLLFPIIGGIKAKDGELWRYPMSIEFLK